MWLGNSSFLGMPYGTNTDCVYFYLSFQKVFSKRHLNVAWEFVVPRDAVRNEYRLRLLLLEFSKGFFKEKIFLGLLKHVYLLSEFNYHYRKEKNSLQIL